MSIKGRFIYFIEYSWLFILLLFASIFYLSQRNIDLFFNSDMLFSVLMIKDLFFQHGHYKDWIIPGAHHFFPELFITSLIYCVVKNIYLYFLIMIWMLITSTYLAVKLIYHQFFSIKKTILFALMATSSLFLLTFSHYCSYSVAGIYPYATALVPFIHIGEFITGLFLLGMQINLINKDKLAYKDYILVAISAFIAFACSLSDLLFFVQFSSPIFCTYSLFLVAKKIKFSRYLLFSGLIIFSTIFGLLFMKYLIPNYSLESYLGYPGLTKISFSTVNAQSLALINQIKICSNYFLRVIYSIFYLSLIFILINKLFIKDINIINYIDKKLFLSLFIFLSIFFSIASQLFLVEPTQVAARYMLPIFYFPFLLFFFPLAYLSNKLLTSIIFNYLAGLFFIYVIASLLFFISKPGFKLHMSYYPEYVHCIDKALHGYGHNGVSQYWEANLITALSKENVEVLPAIDLSPYPCAASAAKFKKPFNFVILQLFTGGLSSRPLEKKLFYSRYGAPDKIVICDKRKILIYSKPMTF